MYPGSIELDQPGVVGVVNEGVDVVGVENDDVLLAGAGVDIVVAGQGD